MLRLRPALAAVTIALVAGCLGAAQGLCAEPESAAAASAVTESAAAVTTAETGYPAATTAVRVSEASLGKELSAAEADDKVAQRPRSTWNEYEGRYLTARLGAGFLIDTASYAQDEASKAQMELSPDVVLRDLRVILKGRFKFSDRLSYSIGYMYDAPNDVWRFRQTGLMVDVPELAGNFFIGRTKEGFSTNKLMTGYDGWTNERATANDSFIPILADGIKWTGSGFGGKFVYNAGWFISTLTPTQPYNKNDKQFAARAVWLPLAGTESKSVLHVAAEARYAASLGGTLQYRSKPESYPAQSYAVDTGKFDAQGSSTYGFEVYYRPGSFSVGSEYFFNQVYSDPKDNPLLHGGEIHVAYLLTGETRPYNERGAYFTAVSPERPVFSGGPGAWEPVLRFSYTDLDDGLIKGGKFWRITPMVNWHLSDNARLEFIYGYSELDRFGIQGGATQYFQTRLQLTLN